MVTVGVDKLCRLESDHLFAGVAVHLAKGGVDLYDVALHIVDNQAIAGCREDSVVLLPRATLGEPWFGLGKAVLDGGGQILLLGGRCEEGGVLNGGLGHAVFPSRYKKLELKRETMCT